MVFSMLLCVCVCVHVCVYHNLFVVCVCVVQVERLCTTGQQKVERIKELYSLESQLDFGSTKVQQLPYSIAHYYNIMHTTHTVHLLSLSLPSTYHKAQ